MEKNKYIPNALMFSTIIKMAKNNRVFDIANAIAATNKKGSRYQHPSHTEIVNQSLSLSKNKAEFAEIPWHKAQS